jgi:hypothetical protein
MQRTIIITAVFSLPKLCYLCCPLQFRKQVKRLLMRWSVTAELSCDRAALLVAQDVNVVVSTLLKVRADSTQC